MKTMFRTGAATALIAGAMMTATPAFAQAADNEATADARAEILSALTLDLQAGSFLDFGKIVVDGTSATGFDAVISEDAVSSSPTIDCGASGLICSGTVNMPYFDVSGGTASKRVAITLPASATLFVDSTDPLAPTMTVSNFTSTETLNPLVQDVDPLTGALLVDLDGFPVLVEDASGAPSPGLTLDAAGEGSFGVGATLNVADTQAVGYYTGSFTVSVNYE